MADVKIKVSSDTTQFQNGMKGVENTLRGIKGSVNILTGAIAAIGIAKLASSFGSFASGLIKDSSSAAMSFETLGVQLEVLTGSATKASKLLSQLRQYGASTPLQQGDIQQTAKTLLSFGVVAEDIVPTLKMLGDASMGDGEKLKSLARVFGQVSSAGRLTMEDVNQMIDAGFNPMSEIAKITGINVLELRDQISDGAVDAATLSQAFRNATSAGGQFNNMLGRIANTNEGKLSNLIDGVEDLKIKFGTGFNEGLGKLLDNGNNLIPQLGASAEAFGRKFGDVLSAIADKLKFDNIKEDLDKQGLTGYLSKVLKDVLSDQGVKDAMSNLGKAIIPKEISESPVTKIGAGVLQNKDQLSTITAIAAYLTKSKILGLASLGLVFKNALQGDKPVKNVSDKVKEENEQYNLRNDTTQEITTIAALGIVKSYSDQMKKARDEAKKHAEVMTAMTGKVHEVQRDWMQKIFDLSKRFAAGVVAGGGGSIVAGGVLAAMGVGLAGYSAYERPKVVAKLEADIARANKQATPEELAKMKADLNARLDKEIAGYNKFKDLQFQLKMDISNGINQAAENARIDPWSQIDMEKYKAQDIENQNFKDMVRSAMLGGTDAESSNFFAGKLLDDSNKKRFASDPYVPVLTSLARIGGAKSTTQDPLVVIQTRANELLQTIANNTKNNNSNRAVFN